MRRVVIAVLRLVLSAAAAFAQPSKPAAEERPASSSR